MNTTTGSGRRSLPARASIEAGFYAHRTVNAASVTLPAALVLSYTEPATIVVAGVALFFAWLTACGMRAASNSLALGVAAGVTALQGLAFVGTGSALGFATLSVVVAAAAALDVASSLDYHRWCAEQRRCEELGWGAPLPRH